MSDIDPAFYRTELAQAYNGDWVLMRDGAVIASLKTSPDGVTPTDFRMAHAWANAQLTRAGVDAGPWLNGMDLPEADSAYFVAEPQRDAPVVAS